MITIEITKKLKEFTLDVSLAFEREIVVLTGPNGSGKTTLLRIIAGLTDADKGRISVANEVFLEGNTSMAPEARNVGYVSQKSTLFPWLTVKENVTFALKKDEQTYLKRWLTQLYEDLDLTHLLARSVTSLSGGEAQRVTLGRALARRPQLLLLDEPFTAVDKELRPRLRTFLKKLQEEWQVPILVVTHDTAEAHVLGERIFEMEAGRIIKSTIAGEMNELPLMSY